MGSVINLTSGPNVDHSGVNHRGKVHGDESGLERNQFLGEGLGEIKKRQSHLSIMDGT